MLSKKQELLAAREGYISSKHARASVYYLNSGFTENSVTNVTVIAVIDADLNFDVFHITCRTVSLLL